MSFLMGIISILSPCILPIIPLFVAFSLSSKSKGEMASFIIGFGSIFIVIIFLTGFFTSIVYEYIAYVRIASATILLAIGILMWFDYTVNLGIRSSENKGGLGGSFILGFITSISWAPCYSAYLISLIALLVSTSNGGYAVFNIFLYVIGFALALVILGFLISKIDLEKLISKTKYVPKIFAVLIIISAIYLFWESLKIFI